jgi:2-polyprenyl-3-methyl-5-hydroxy-6-metoxy-1,4-benzoquinol methylase
MAAARYDDIAEWYPDWVGDGDGIVAEGVGDLVPAALSGTRVLDVACGHGRAARAFARRGATVVGVDVSVELIRVARARETRDGLGVDYRVADITDVGAWWDRMPFAGAVCEMALMDIDDLDGTCRAVATTVAPGGWFAVSIVHPCFPGNEAGLSSWPPDATYFDEGRWTSAQHNPDGVRIRVGSSHRTVSTYVMALVDAGFALERIVEPVAPVPMLLLLRGRRVA